MGEILFLQDYLGRMCPAHLLAEASSSQPPESAITQACRAMSDSVLRMREASQHIVAAAAALRDLARGEP